MTAVDELVAFVRAALDARERQLDEDERVARECEPELHRKIVEWTLAHGPQWRHRQSLHIATWDPARVLDEVKIGRSEVKTKRGLLADYDTAVRQQAENSVKFVAMTDGRPSNESDYVAVKTHGWTIAGRLEGLRVAIARAAQPFAGRPGWRDEWAIDPEQL